MRWTTSSLALALLSCASGVAPPSDGDGGGQRAHADARGRTEDGAALAEVLRLAQEFHGNDDYAVVVDAWVVAGPPPAIVDVAMRWVDTANGDKRSPFGRGVRRHVSIDRFRREDGSWLVTLETEDAHREIEIALDREGVPRPTAEVVVGPRQVRCQPHGGRLAARRMLGIPVALDRLELRCLVDGAEVIAEAVTTVRAE